MTSNDSKSCETFPFFFVYGFESFTLLHISFVLIFKAYFRVKNQLTSCNSTGKGEVPSVVSVDVKGKLASSYSAFHKIFGGLIRLGDRLGGQSVYIYIHGRKSSKHS